MPDIKSTIKNPEIKNTYIHTEYKFKCEKVVHFYTEFLERKAAHIFLSSMMNGTRRVFQVFSPEF